jgi:DNA polymerase III epsilon subunit-like protein
MPVRSGMVHLNHNLMCCIDVETTGTRPGFHEIIQLSILPLDRDLNRADPDRWPVFDMYIQPEHPERAAKVGTPITKQKLDTVMEHGLPNQQAKDIFFNWYHQLDWCNKEDYVAAKVQQAIAEGVDKYEAADLLDNWFTNIGLPDYKMIVPLAFNWAFDRSFLYEWLGHETFEAIFYYHYRDPMIAANFCNDVASYNAVDNVFNRLRLQNVAAYLGIEFDRDMLHDAHYDCELTRLVYKKMITRQVVIG